MPNDDDYDYLYRVGENSYQDPWNARTLFGPRENRALTSQETVDVVGRSPGNETPVVMNYEKDYHPADMREGLIEKGIKWAAGKSGSSLGHDRVYLEQYLHPERDIIPKQSLRPTQLSNMPDMEFRRVPYYQVIPGPNSKVTRPNTIGLGGHTKGETPTYTSIYDTWDFDTKSPLVGNKESTGILPRVGNWAAKKFMQNVGTPFAVYERTPKPPDYEGPNMMGDEPGTAIPLDNVWQTPDDFYKSEAKKKKKKK